MPVSKKLPQNIEWREQLMEDEIRSWTSPPSESYSLTSIPTASMPISLHINNLGHCPSFKNNKMLVKGKLITDPKKQKWMNQAIRQLKSQLLSASQTTEGETSMGEPQPSSTALLMRLKGFDDCRQWVPELHIRCEIVEKGNEGVDIVIEEL